MINPLRARIIVIMKGAAMGAADIVPGVSGGTIAFITGIYETLINALKSFDLAVVKLLFKGQFKAIWAKVNGAFLLNLFVGMIASILLISRLMSFLFNEYPTFLWSFFLGLIVASSWTIIRASKRWSAMDFFFFIIGIVAAWLITDATPASTSESFVFVLLTGAIAISAMILPGISGSFILVIFGKYFFILDALNALNFKVIITFMLGCVIGLISFSRIISWMFKNYHNLTISLLAGFMLGSINKVWPWKKTMESMINQYGESIPLVHKNVLPYVNSDLIYSILLMIAGGLLVLVLSRKSTAIS